MDDTVLSISRIVMRGNAIGSLKDAALIDSDIDDDSAVVHWLDHLFCDKLGGSCAWNQYRTDH